jgi:hypothetical protein
VRSDREASARTTGGAVSLGGVGFPRSLIEQKAGIDSIKRSGAANVSVGSWPCQNASLGRSESREVGDARGMFRSDYALIAAISG